MGGWGCTGARLHRRAPIGPRLHRRAPIGPRLRCRAPIGPLSLLALLYKVATLAVRMVPGRSARILGGCGAVSLFFFENSFWVSR